MNKQIIEIKCTNSEYFDRALLFVNSYSDMFSETDPRVKAEEYLEMLNEEFDIDADSKKLRTDRTVGTLVRIVLGIMVLSALVILLFALG